MSTLKASRTPQGRMAPATRARPLSIAGVRKGAALLTLFTLQPFTPTEASRRAYSATGARSSRTLPPSKKIDRPA
jgi:hypothetical protein